MVILKTRCEFGRHDAQFAEFARRTPLRIVPKIKHSRKYRNDFFARLEILYLSIVAKCIVEHDASRHPLIRICLVFESKKRNTEPEIVFVQLEYVSKSMQLMLIEDLRDLWRYFEQILWF